MKFRHILLVVFFSLLTAFATTRYMSPTNVGQIAAKESVYERVLRTGTLRCGYQYSDAAVMRDEKTGEIYGPWVDLMKAIGEATGLKVEWVAQVGWDDVGAALKSQKIDAMCAGMWTSAVKSKEISFTNPLAYQAVEAFVRGDDHRFDANLQTANDPHIKIAVIENDNSDFITHQDFPQAERIALGQMNGTDSDLMMHVMSGKADMTFSVTGLWRQFNKSNPDKIRRAAPDTKLRVFGLALAVDNAEPRLLQVLNAAEQEIQNSGKADKIFDVANQTWPDMFIKPLKPFP